MMLGRCAAFIALLRQHHEQGRRTNNRTMCMMSLASEAVKDQENRPDDEKHERDDPKQLVQFGALRTRREQLFEGCHTSGRFEDGVTGRERERCVHQAKRPAVLPHGLSELGVLPFFASI